MSSKGETEIAIRYPLSRWLVFTRYTEDGLLEIDNNAAERALRTVALREKNFCFTRSNSVGVRAAPMYPDRLGQAHGLDPELYLRTVLAQIDDHSISHILDLLPSNMAASLRAD